MQLDTIALKLRLRSPMESADLGVRLCQDQSRAVYSCLALAAIPMMALCLATYEIASWLPGLLIWWGKPWLDRTILFVLARAAFSQPTTWRDVLQAQRKVWWSQLLRTWTTRRLSPWRSYTQSVHQLEGLTGKDRRQRIKQIRFGKTGSAMLVTSAFSLVELIFTVSLLLVVYWLIPKGLEPNMDFLFKGDSTARYWELIIALAYAVVVFVLEPLYVAAGFSMYLNRRVELEAWDIEQELRRVFTR